MEPSAESLTTLPAALAHFDIALDDNCVAAIDTYREALWAWNEKLNLTRHTDFEKFAARDVLDSIKLAEHLDEGQHILDVGSGGGVPGALLALLRDDLDVTLCESVGKKAQALAAIVEDANVPVSVVHGRAEDLLTDAQFDTLTLRAVAALPKILKWFQPHWSQFERLLLIKGRNWATERGTARHLGLMADLQLRRLTSYLNPDLQSESVILEIRPKGGA